MQIKSVIIDNTHYINLITFNIRTFFYLVFPAENGEHLIHLCVLCAVKYDNSLICMYKITRDRMTCR